MQQGTYVPLNIFKEYTDLLYAIFALGFVKNRNLRKILFKIHLSIFGIIGSGFGTRGSVYAYCKRLSECFSINYREHEGRASL